MPDSEAVDSFRFLLVVFLVLALGCVKKTEKEPGSLAASPNSNAIGPVVEDTKTHSAFVSTAADEEREIQFAEVFRSDADGWKTEAFTLAADAQLKQLGKLFISMATNVKDPPLSKLSKLVADRYQGSKLRPDDLHEVFKSPSLVARRSSPQTQALNVLSSKGRTGCVESLQRLADRLENAENLRVKFKIVKIEMSANTVETTVLLLVSGNTPSGGTQINAQWEVNWKFSDEQTAPTIERIQTTDYEELESLSRPLFGDETETVFGVEPAYRDQLSRGIEYWRERIPQHLGIYYFGHHGLAVGDVNGDGLDDLYVCQPGGLPNRLFLHMADGTATDASSESRVNVLNNSRSALIVDLDNDGDSDLVVTATDRVLFFDNDGTGRFRLAKSLTDVRGGYTTSAVDFDSDGLLDIYVSVYLNHAANEGRLPFPVPYHDANNGGQNVLLRNEGNWSFADVTEQVGLNQDNSRFSYVGTWEDFDRDGDMDLYVANDFGRNCLYRNDDGHFQNVAEEVGLEDTGFGMSATWGDFNRDGYMDLYVGNMFSGAGNRIAFQSRFQKNASPETRKKLQRSARGNSLFQNLGDGTFRDVSIPAAVTMGRWSWGTLFADLNNNGWQDLVVMNGMVTGQSSADL